MTNVSPGRSMSAAFCRDALLEPITSAVPDWATVMVRFGMAEPATDREVQETLANTYRTRKGNTQRFIRSLSLIFIPAVLLFGQGDEAAIRQVVQKYVDARESMDAKAIEALFTEDADQLVSTGEWRKGRGEVVKGTMASSQSSTGKRTITVVSVRFPAPGVAIADGRYEIAGAVTRSMWTTLVLTRGSDGWRIAAIRNMLPAPAAPSK
jgi:uncharacterized protein (TIGR02246 family)